MRLVRTDRWDEATRGEWEDIKRSGSAIVVAVTFVLVDLLARLVTTSYLVQLGIAACVGAIVGVGSGGLQKRRSRIDAAKTHSDPSA